jgi:hypothetical protein
MSSVSGEGEDVATLHGQGGVQEVMYMMHASKHPLAVGLQGGD